MPTGDKPDLKKMEMRLTALEKSHREHLAQHEEATITSEDLHSYHKVRSVLGCDGYHMAAPDPMVCFAPCGRMCQGPCAPGTPPVRRSTGKRGATGGASSSERFGELGT